MHRCLLHLLFESLLLIASTPAIMMEAPVSEVLEASDVPAWTLLIDLFASSWDVLPFMVAGFAAGVAHIVRWAIKKGFFAYEISNSRLVTTRSGQQETMMYFHELAEMGKYVCIVVMALSSLGTVALCALLPQPRACIVIRSYVIAVFYTHVGLPLVSAIACTFILCMARAGPTFDLLLTANPDIMDFVTVGVENPDFLRWRVERVVTEQEQLQLVYSGEWASDELDHLDMSPLEEAQAEEKKKKRWIGKVDEFIREVREHGFKGAVKRRRDPDYDGEDDTGNKVAPTGEEQPLSEEPLSPLSPLSPDYAEDGNFDHDPNFDDQPADDGALMDQPEDQEWGGAGFEEAAAGEPSGDQAPADRQD